MNTHKNARPTYARRIEMVQDVTQRGLGVAAAAGAHGVNLVANGMTPAEIVAEHPDLEEDDVRQALVYAAAIAEDQISPIPAGK